MLSSERRLPRREVAETIRRGRPFGDKLLSFRLLQTVATQPSRLAIVVSAKTAKLAVDRNLLKRRLRSIIRESDQELPTGYNIVIFAGSGAKTLPYPELKVVFHNLCRKSFT